MQRLNPEADPISNNLDTKIINVPLIFDGRVHNSCCIQCNGAGLNILYASKDEILTFSVDQYVTMPWDGFGVTCKVCGFRWIQPTSTSHESNLFKNDPESSLDYKAALIETNDLLDLIVCHDPQVQHALDVQKEFNDDLLRIKKKKDKKDG